MDFDARIGQRFDVHGASAHWEPHGDTEWVGRLRRARGESDSQPAGNANGGTNAIIENVSVSGAGLLAPADPRSVVDTSVTVTLGPGSSFEARIRRILPSDDIGWAYFGVEFTSVSDVFQNWLDRVIESHRGSQRNNASQHT